jgi:hypothetical protein
VSGQVALHEAAHAIVAAVLGFRRPRWITLGPSAGVQHEYAHYHLLLLAMIHAAGPAADIEFGYSHTWPVSLEGQALPAYLVVWTAQSTVRQYRTSIEDLARRLEDAGGYLAGDELADAIAASVEARQPATAGA